MNARTSLCMVYGASHVGGLTVVQDAPTHMMNHTEVEAWLRELIDTGLVPEGRYLVSSVSETPISGHIGYDYLTFYHVALEDGALMLHRGFPEPAPSSSAVNLTTWPPKTR